MNYYAQQWSWQCASCGMQITNGQYHQCPGVVQTYSPFTVYATPPAPPMQFTPQAPVEQAKEEPLAWLRRQVEETCREGRSLS